MKYLIQLDSLRAFAVLAVLFQHTWSTAFEMGAKGVHLFFVLSGFLITGILLSYRDEVDKGAPVRSVLGKFYFRRTLRIFPVYYVTVLLIALVGVKNGRESLLWNLSYLSNFKCALDGTFNNSIAHFWSLCVEEQFYLFWPFLILFTGRKFLKPAIIATALIGPVSRLALGLAFPQNMMAQYVLPFACLDYLALGAFLAYERHFGGAKRFANASLLIGVCLCSLLYLLSELVRLPAYLTFLYGTFEALICVGLVHHISVGITGYMKKIMECNILVYLGKISYGIYLYHVFVAMLVGKTFNIIGKYSGNSCIKFISVSILSVLAASISWYFIEKPINSFKDLYYNKKIHPSSDNIAIITEMT